MTFPTEWKNKIHVPNHQPDNCLSLKPKYQPKRIIFQLQLLVVARQTYGYSPVIQHSYGKSPCLMGKSPFLMGKSQFLIGKSQLLMGKPPFLTGMLAMLVYRRVVSPGLRSVCKTGLLLAPGQLG